MPLEAYSLLSFCPPAHLHKDIRGFQSMLPVGEEGGGDSQGPLQRDRGGSGSCNTGGPTPSSIRAAPVGFVFYIVDLYNISNEKRDLQRLQI